MKERVLIVGAGVIGLAIAFRLKREGYAVQIVSRDFSWQASGAAAGVLFPTSGKRSQGEAGKRSLEALTLWSQFEKDIGQEVSRGGGISLLGNDENLPELECMARAADLLIRPLRPSHEHLSSDHLPEHELFIADGRIVKPRNLLFALRSHLEGSFVVDQARDLIVEQNRVVGVRGDRDDYKADHTVLALGALGYNWIPEKMRPQVVPLIGEALLLHLESRPPLLAATYPLHMEDETGPLLDYGDGELWLGGSYRRDEVIAPRFSEIERIMRQGRKSFPWLIKASVKGIVFGVRPVSPDGLPFVGQSEKEGLYLATGHGKDGILQAPLAAEQMLRSIKDGLTEEILSPQRRSSF